MRLEADPAVSTFCERPARLTEEPAARLVEFWVQVSYRKVNVELSDEAFSQCSRERVPDLPSPEGK
jgi:hypothetical protein